MPAPEQPKRKDNWHFPLDTPFGVIERKEGWNHLQSILFPYLGELRSANPINSKNTTLETGGPPKPEQPKAQQPRILDVRLALYQALKKAGVPEGAIEILTPGRINVREEVFIFNRVRYPLRSSAISLYKKLCSLIEQEHRQHEERMPGQFLSPDELRLFPPGWRSNTEPEPAPAYGMDDGGDLLMQLVDRVVTMRMASEEKQKSDPSANANSALTTIRHASATRIPASNVLPANIEKEVTEKLIEPALGPEAEHIPDADLPSDPADEFSHEPSLGEDSPANPNNGTLNPPDKTEPPTTPPGFQARPATSDGAMPGGEVGPETVPPPELAHRTSTEPSLNPDPPVNSNGILRELDVGLKEAV